MQNVLTSFPGDWFLNDEDRAFIAEQIPAMVERWRSMLASYRSIWSLLQRPASHEVERLVEQIANFSASIERMEPSARFQNFLDEARIINHLGRICWALDSHATSVRQVWLRIAELLASLGWNLKQQDMSTSSPEPRSSWNAILTKQMGLLPPPSCVQASIDEELAAARLVLAARPKEVVPEEEASPVEKTPVVATASRTLTVSDWASLLIGYASDNQILAFYPAPRLGARIVVKRGTTIDIRSTRWKQLIRLLTTMPDGRTVGFPDAWTALCQTADNATTTGEKRSHMTNAEIKTLRQAAAEINQQLRRALGGPRGHRQAPIRILKGRQCLQARFLTRQLVLDGTESDHLGNAPNDPAEAP